MNSIVKFISRAYLWFVGGVILTTAVSLGGEKFGLGDSTPFLALACLVIMILVGVFKGIRTALTNDQGDKPTVGAIWGTIGTFFICWLIIGLVVGLGYEAIVGQYWSKTAYSKFRGLMKLGYWMIGLGPPARMSLI